MRYERKFVPDGLDPDDVLRLVRFHPAAFHEVYPERRVHNLYFDTLDRRHYFDHVNGTARRVKIRVRWYTGPGARGSTPALEFKHKDGLLGTKESFTFPGAIREAAATSPRKLLDHLRRNGPPDTVRLRLDALEPALGNTYRRRYFLSADHRFRLTLDWDLQFTPPGRPEEMARGNGLPLVVVELKYAASVAPLAPAIANAFPFRLHRCSKYVLGIDALAPAA